MNQKIKVTENGEIYIDDTKLDWVNSVDISFGWDVITVTPSLTLPPDSFKFTSSGGEELGYKRPKDLTIKDYSELALRGHKHVFRREE